MSSTDAVLVMMPNQDMKDRFDPIKNAHQTPDPPSVDGDDDDDDEKAANEAPAPSPSSDEEEVGHEAAEEAEDEDDEDSDEGSAQPAGGMETGRWSHEEHARFLKGLDLYGRRKWQKIAELVKTRNTIQVRSHAQKYFKKIKKETEVVVVPPTQPYRRPTRMARGRQQQQQQQQQQEYMYLGARNDVSSQQQRCFEPIGKHQQQQNFELGKQHGAYRNGGVPRQPQRRYTYNTVVNKASPSLKRRSYGDYPTAPFQLPDASPTDSCFTIDTDGERRAQSPISSLEKRLSSSSAGGGEYQPKRRRSFSDHAFDDLCTIASSILLSDPSRPAEQQRQQKEGPVLTSASRSFRATLESLDAPASTLRQKEHQQIFRGGEPAYNMIVPAPASAYHLSPNPPPMPAALKLPVPYRTKPFVLG